MIGITMINPHDDFAASGSAAAASALDLDMIRKYAVPGPRYTSYPPANKFHDKLETVDLGGGLRADNADASRPLSLYFHLPFCESRCWYCGCTTIITRHKEWALSYEMDLEREMDLVGRELNPGRLVDQLHFGGGTPTFFDPVVLERLGAAIHRRFRFAPDAELSVEIDPRCATPDHLRVLRDFGINRASLGIQDTNPAVQEAVHRIQPHETNHRVVDGLRAAGIRAINLDLIYGLPLQTPDSVERTVDDALELAPDRLSVFSYAHVPWIKPAQRIFDKRGQMPGPAEKLEMFSRIRARLHAAGYVDIGLDHFARPGDELAVALREGKLHRNFQGYSTRSGASLYGFGISSISQSPDLYWQNHKSLIEYRRAVGEGRLPVERGYRLSDEDKRRRRLVMAVMCERGLDFGRLSAEFGLDVRRRYGDELASLQPLVADGIVEVDADGLRVMPKGEPLLRVVAMAFDQTLAKGVRAHAMTV